jgi:hypothetical protein
MDIGRLGEDRRCPPPRQFVVSVHSDTTGESWEMEYHECLYCVAWVDSSDHIFDKPILVGHPLVVQFLAVRSDRPVPREFQGHYVHKQDVDCHLCRIVTYQLHAPILETEVDQIPAQSEWLNAHLPKTCPNHPDYLITPDRPGG